MGIPLLQGRNFESSDALLSHRVVLIDAQLAREFFGGQDPVGKRIEHYGPAATVIGVVGSTSQKEVGGPPKATVYYFVGQYPRNPITLVIARRTTRRRSRDLFVGSFRRSIRLSQWRMRWQ